MGALVGGGDDRGEGMSDDIWRFRIVSECIDRDDSSCAQGGMDG